MKPSKARQLLSDSLGQSPMSLPQIKRGRGVHLSTEQGTAQETTQETAQESESAPPQLCDSAPAQKNESVTPQKSESVPAQKSTSAPAHYRVKRGYSLREDLVKACKRIALEEDRKLYAVMEEALETYLKDKTV